MPIRLLYAEDSAHDADLTRAVFEAQGSDFALEIVGTGSRCLERARAGEWDVVMLDHHLPDMDGLEVLRELNARGLKAPVVMVTGAGHAELVVEALRAGAADYVSKSGEYRATLPELLRGVVEEHGRESKLGVERTSLRRSILYVEPNPMDRDLTTVQFAAQAPHLALTCVDDSAEALRRLSRQHDFDLVLTDLRTPGMSALEFLREARHRGIHLPFVVVTGQGDEAAAVAALRLGAYDYLVKRDNYLTQLPVSIENALSRFQLSRLAERQREELVQARLSLEEKVAARTSALVQEIHEHREAQEALRSSEARHRLLLDGMTDAYASVSMDGRIEDANEAFTRLLGFSIQELRARGFEDLTPEHWRAGERRILEEEVLASGSSGVYEKEYLCKDGTVLPVELRTFLIRNDAGRPTGMWAIVRDIRERKRAEQERERLQEQLLQAQKLESAGRLAGGVAHDFNNMLTVILSCCEELRLELGSGSAAQLESVGEIQTAAERARDLTRQLLAFARKQVIAPVVLDANGVLHGSEKLLRRVLGENVQLGVELQPDLWPVRCDPGQLEQVILNLALNARDAMPGGGFLTIQSRNLPAGTVLQPGAGPPLPFDSILLTFRDTGAGMSAEVQRHLFEPFFTTKSRGLGTGLGLAMVHGIVNQSGGQVRVQSEPGRGCAFYISLPRATEAVPTADPTPRHPAARGGTEIILLVEDERQVRDVTARVLRHAGYRVLTARDGAEALALAAGERGRLALVITDVIMPGLDGRAVAQELRQRHGPLRVLYLSGYTQEVISHSGVLDPGVHFLAKPFTTEALLAEVRGALDANPGS